MQEVLLLPLPTILGATFKKSTIPLCLRPHRFWNISFSDLFRFAGDWYVTLAYSNIMQPSRLYLHPLSLSQKWEVRIFDLAFCLQYYQQIEDFLERYFLMLTFFHREFSLYALSYDNNVLQGLLSATNLKRHRPCGREGWNGVDSRPENWSLRKDLQICGGKRSCKRFTDISGETSGNYVNLWKKGVIGLL